jgi:FkbM family methyltransferase
MHEMNHFKNEINNIKELLISNLLDSNDSPKNYIFHNNSNIIQSYFTKQNSFCNNFYNYYNELIENKIRLTNFSINNISFPLFIYKKYDYISNAITKIGNYEKKELSNALDALKFYSQKNDITNNKNIVVLDIGGNIGLYPLYLGIFGYTILTFEPSPINYYILNKNYCINQNSNIIIINKGLSNKESNCSYYYNKNNIGNGILMCNDFKAQEVSKQFIKLCDVTLTKLNNFFPYLSDKHIALIKIDIEGSEENALEGGIELITNFHVPFILMEYTPIFLKEHNTDPINFLKLFINNGYKVSMQGFLSGIFISIEEIIKRVTFQVNLYFIHKNYIL